MATADADALQRAKRVVRALTESFDGASDEDLVATLAAYTTSDYFWRGVHPFYEQSGAAAAVEAFWLPLRRSFTRLQRRPDIFLAGRTDPDTASADDESVWVCQMGHLMGLFDEPWLAIPPTRKMAFLRFAEFHRVIGDRVAESALFCDVISVMQQAGHDPLPPQTGGAFVHPGPRSHDGLLFDPQEAAEGPATMALVNRMIADLGDANRIANERGDDRVPASSLATSWHDDMIWYGPAGIGATYTIPRYQEQHQYPFRFGLTNKEFHGHVARFAEGSYACFFGWSNLTNSPAGGFLGLPASDTRAEMRVVDVYRREGDKLAENWVFIDLLHWLSMLGLDVLARLRRELGLEEL